MLPAAVRVAVAALLLTVALTAIVSGAVVGATGQDAVAASGTATEDAAGSSAPDATRPTAQNTARSTVQDSVDCAQRPPSDHADPGGETGDAIGWVDGYWYDEPLGFETDDGLQGEERERLVARTAARAEALRCLDFEELPSVRVQTREAFATDITEQYENESDRIGDLMNAEAAAMLLIGPDRDWADVQTAVLSGGVGAYYEPGSDRITMLVDEAGDRPREPILGHELVHALQDQHFDIGRFDASLRSTYDAERGVIEGDATLVQRAYARRCEGGSWAGSCVAPADSTAPDLPDDLGVVMLFQQSYLYGPSYVDDARQRGDWSAVDELFDDVPEHSASVVAPNAARNVTVELPDAPDRSTDEWERVTAGGRPDYDVVGQASLTTTFYAPAIEGNPNATIVTRSDLLDPATGRLSQFDQPETTGWRGDRLYAYSNGERLASVWALSWADAAQAERFASAYERLVELRGGESVEGSERTYRLPESTGFDAAVQLRVDDSRMTIVTAPTVDDLDAVHEPETASTGGPTPGFGPGAALLGLLLAVATASVLGRRSGR